MSQTYAIAPAVRLQLLGVALATAGLLVGVPTLLVAYAGVPDAVLTAAVVLALLVVVAAVLLVGRSSWVLRLDDAGYRLRRVRGVGVSAAAWADVVDVATGESGGRRLLQLRLRDGGVTLIPVDLLATDREELVRVVRDKLPRVGGPPSGPA